MSGTVPLTKVCVCLPRSPLELTHAQADLEERQASLEERMKLFERATEDQLSSKLVEILAVLRAVGPALKQSAAEIEQLEKKVRQLELKLVLAKRSKRRRERRIKRFSKR